MKKIFKKVIATGLIASMLTGFNACDKLDNLNNNTNENNVNTENKNDVDNNYFPYEEQNKPDYLKGSVWASIKNKEVMSYDHIPYEEYHNLENCPIPITFLLEIGMLSYDVNGKLQINNGIQQYGNYIPFKVMGYKNAENKNNEVYLLLEYLSCPGFETEVNDDMYIATWMLKYELDDEDYETFLKLENDFRITYFIQEMDKQYEPQLLHSSVIKQKLMLQLAHFNKDSSSFPRPFPYVFVADIDYENHIVTYGGQTYTGAIRYFSVDIRETNAWTKAITKLGLTEEEREEKICIETMPTQAGICLTNFSVATLIAGLTKDQSEEAFSNSIYGIKTRPVDIHSNEKTYFQGQ